MSMLAPLFYLKRRIGEPSTWAGIVAIITGAAALSPPYSWLVIAAGTIGALVAEKAGTNNAN